MSSRHPRFVTLCQQLLVLGVICAALTPAANVISLELVPHPPGEADAPASAASGELAPVQASMAAYVRASQLKATVPAGIVDPIVKEYSLTARAGARVAPGALKATSSRRATGAEQLVSAPQPVTGYGSVGVTWAHGTKVAEDAITLRVRTKQDDAWSEWIDLEYHDDHGPDAGSAEAAHARPGTDELLVGDVDDVQVRIDTVGTPPADIKLAVIDPGVATATKVERAAIDTSTLPSAEPAVATDGTGSTDATDGITAAPATMPETDSVLSSSEGDLALAKTTFTPKPQIFSRAQWGADEKMRDASSLHYYEVHAGFVHHTVNANNYKAADVPAILRGIYAYHTKSRGWSDVGYNYLVDRFGRIWEGRYGGVDRPVVGAHTLGYNDDAFAMSAIGNFEEVKPSEAMVQAYGALFGWKLSLHGVDASSTKQYVTKRYFKAINGHRDAASTACPGKYLYARIPDIRKLAKQAQVGFSGRQLESNVVATPLPDLFVRRASDGMGFVIPLKARAANAATASNGLARFRLGRAVAMNFSLRRAAQILNVGDWDRDGFTDLVLRRTGDGVLVLRRGLGAGKFSGPVVLSSGLKGIKLLSAPGDMTGDGYPDLMGQPAGKGMMIYPGKGLSGLGAPYVAFSAVAGAKQIGIGLWNTDGAPDSLVRTASKLTLYPGNGPGGLTGAAKLALNVTPFDWVVGINDADAKGGHPDLIVRQRTTGNVFLIEATSRVLGVPGLLALNLKGYDLVQ